MSLDELGQICARLRAEIRDLSFRLQPWDNILTPFPLPTVPRLPADKEDTKGNADDVITEIRRLAGTWGTWVEDYRRAAEGARKKENLQAFVDSLKLAAPQKDAAPISFAFPEWQAHYDGLWTEYSTRPKADPRREIRAQVKLFVTNRLRTNRYVPHTAQLNDLFGLIQRVETRVPAPP
jgi:hypothetical protein